MSILKFRLQKVGFKNNPRYWIIVQPSNKSYKSNDMKERVANIYNKKRITVERSLVLNRHRILYWLSTGAHVSDGAYRYLCTAGFLPKKPVPFGTHNAVSRKKDKVYSLKDFQDVQWGVEGYSKATRFADYTKQYGNFILHKIHELDKLADNTKEEGLAKLRESGEFNLDLSSKSYKEEYKTDIDTDLVTTDEPDFPRRIRNFHILSKKIKNYIDNDYYRLKGKDQRWHNYLRKVNIYTRKNGIDVESYEKYIEFIKKEEEKNELIKAKKTLKFKNEYKTSKVLREKFFRIFNEGKVDEKAFLEFAEDETSKIMKEFDFKLDRILQYRKDDELKGDLIGVFDKKPKKKKELFQDYVYLRFAKLMKKLKEGYLYSLNDKNNNIDIKDLVTLGKNMRTDFLKVIDSKILDAKTLKVANEKFNKDKGLHISFYNKVNELLLKSNTFKKFEHRLFLNQQLNMKNFSLKDKTKVQVYDFYNLNDKVIEDICQEIENVVLTNYELNDVYDDNKPDTQIKVKNSKEINKRINALKDKYQELDLAFDSIYSPNEEKKKEINELTSEYEFELVENGILDAKFKQCYRRFDMKLKEEDNREYFAQLFNKVVEDITQERKGLKEPYIFKNDINDSEDYMYSRVRREVETEILGSTNIINEYDNLSVDVGIFKADFEPVFVTKGRTYSKSRNNNAENPELQHVHDINKKKFESAFTIQKNIAASFKIKPFTKNLILERFEELFDSNEAPYLPIGFKHLANLESYQTMFPEATPDDFEKESKFNK